MIWPAAVLADLAAKAGWTGGDLVEAVAVALASSGGDDQLTTVDPIVPAWTRVGLWQIAVGQVDDPTARRLTVPSVNARAARFVYETAGGVWGAFPAFEGPMWRQALADAGTAVQAPQRGILTDNRPPSTRAGRAAGAARHAALDAAAQLAGLERLGRGSPRL